MLTKHEIILTSLADAADNNTAIILRTEVGETVAGLFGNESMSCRKAARRPSRLHIVCLEQ